MVKKVSALILSMALLSLMVVPVSAGISVTIRNNGALSTNFVNINKTQTGVIVQTNHARISNTVLGGANTGWNTAVFNTGGPTVINTGNARVGISIRNRANFNWAKISFGCNDNWCQL